EEVQFLEVGCPGGDPAIVVPVGVAVSLGEGKETPRRGMSDAAQEIEKVSWAIGDRRASEEIDLSRTDQGCARIVRYAQQFEAVQRSLAVVLDEVGLVEDDAGPRGAVKTLGIPGEDVVIYDHPARIGLLAIRDAQNFDPGVRV